MNYILNVDFVNADIKPRNALYWMPQMELQEMRFMLAAAASCWQPSSIATYCLAVNS